MPKVPGIDIATRPPGGTVRVQDSPQTTSVMAGAQVGSALQTLGDRVDAVTTHLFDTYQETKAGEAVSDAQKRMQDVAYGLKYGGVDPATGSDTPPPGPEQHLKIFQDEAERINQEAQSSLSGKALRIFNGEFRPMAQRQELSVKMQAAELYRDQNRAMTDETLQKDAVNFVEEDDLGKGRVKEAAFGRIDRMELRGVYTPQEALAAKRRFVNDASAGSIIKMMKSDALNGPLNVVRAIDAGEFKDLPADDQERWKAKALDAHDRAVTKGLREEERNRVLAEKEQKKVQEETAKNGITLIGKGKLNPDWVEKNRDNLSLEYFKFFSNASTGRADVHSNSTVLADLVGRAASGEDVTRDALRQNLAGNLSQEHLLHVIETANKEGVVTDSSNWRKRGADYIKRALDDKDNPAAKIALARGMDEWLTLSRNNPKWTPDQAKTQYEAIVNSFRLVAPDDFGTLAIGLPKYLKGGRAQLPTDNPDLALENLKKAYKETEDRYKAGEIKEDEWTSERAKLKRLGVFYQKRKPVQPATGVPVK